jgi:hypothetical protein
MKNIHAGSMTGRVFMPFDKAFPAEGLISIFFPEQNLLLVFYDAVGIMCQVSAIHANGM